MDNNEEKKEEYVLSVDIHNIGQCRICLEEDDINNMISPCYCSGSVNYVHLDCLNEWRETSMNPESKTSCLVCKFNYIFEKMPVLYYHILLSYFSYNFIAFCGLHCCIFLPLLITQVFHNERKVYFYLSNVCWYIIHGLYLSYIKKRYLKKRLNHKLISTCINTCFILVFIFLFHFSTIVIMTNTHFKNEYIQFVPLLLVCYYMDYCLLYKIKNCHLKVIKKQNPKILSV